MRFWGWIGFLYGLMLLGTVIMLQGGTAGSACRATGAFLQDVARGGDGFPQFWDGLRGIGRSIEDACSHR